MNRLGILILLVCIFNLGWFWQGPLAKKNSQGNRLYQDGKIDEALSKYRDAQIENPDSKELHYNIGNALHENKKYEDSLKEHEKALDTKDVTLQAKTYYNMGNTHYRMGKLLEAIEDYKRCLDINPDDEDAKYNIEFIRKKIKEQLEKEEQKQSQAQQQEQARAASAEEEQKEGQTQEEKKEEMKEVATEEKSEEKQGEEKEGAQKEKAGEKEGQEKPKEGEMSKEDAIRLLDALKDDEKDLQRELRRQPIEGEYRVEKDW